MNYCSLCGSANMVFTVPEDDTYSRHICRDCDTIFYDNPKIIAGCILEWEDSILLCKRAIEPKVGLWTVPAGFMENHESVAEAAAREAMEEACAQSDALQLQGIYDLKHINQVYMIYRGGLLDKRAESGKETLEVGLYREHEIPWDNIAFLVVREALERHFEDRTSGKMKLHTADIDCDDSGKVKVVRRG